MASRGRSPQPARLLDASPDPVYLVDERRRLTFVNAACARWVGLDAEALVDRECRYRSDEPADRVAAVADALGPPPSAFAGRRVSAEIALPPTADGAAAASRRADFIPLGINPAGVTAVLVWLPSPEIAERDAAELERQEQESERLHAGVAKLRRALAATYAVERFVGVSPAVRRIRSQIPVAAAASVPLSIVGPPGSGRGHVARAVHYHRSAAGATSPDAAGPLVPLDAKTLSAELLQSTVRGMIRTGRESGRRLGTLLLNDVDRLALDAQAELAALAQRADPLPRLIVTSARRLNAADGPTFRPDLAEALSPLVIEIPPLAARSEDVPSLAQALLEQCNVAGGKQLGGFAPEALDRLALYAWPGETAELFEIVSAAHAAAEGPLVAADELSAKLRLAEDAQRYARPSDETIDLDAFLQQVERELIQRAVRRAGGNKTQAAKLLGLNRPRLYRRMIQLGLEAGPVVFEEADDAPGAVP